MRVKRKNPQAKELTYEQVETRKDRGVEGLQRMGEASRAETLDDESVEDFAERKGITIVNPRGKNAGGKKREYVVVMGQRVLKGSKKHEQLLQDKRRYDDLASSEQGRGRNNPRPRKRNGEIEDAQAMFQKFHGRKSTTIEEVRARQHYRKIMSGLGVLMFLRTDLTQEWNGKGVGLTFSEDDKVVVASDPAGNQIYFLGGNQDVTGIMPKAQLAANKDFIDMGECDVIIYTADKDFDNFEEKDYQHEFGEETGERPRLMFDRLNQQLYLIGGAYEVKREGIVN